jgi:hypothetical protein
MPEKAWAPARERFLALRRNLLPPSTEPWDPAAWEAWLGEIRREAAASEG